MMINDLFDAAVPIEFQENSLRLVLKTCRQSRDDVRARYTFPEDKYLYGHERWAMLNRDWFTLARSFAHRGLEVSHETNRIENFHFTEVRSGPVILTAAAVDNRTQLPRHADFRQTRARSSQLSLFEEPVAPSDAPLYAILIYGGHSIGTPFPKFVDFAFPAREGRFYAHRIPLYERFFSIYEYEKNRVTVEEVPDTLEPELNENIHQRGEQSA